IICYFGMNILYCGDKGIERGVLVSILSILKNNKGELHFYIMTISFKDTKPFTKKAAEFLDSLVKKTNAKSFVKLINATEVFVANLPKKNMGSYFTPASMLRLYVDKIPEIARLDRVLYLDYDVVCRGDLKEFFETDLDGFEAAGVLDIYGKNFYHYRGLFNFDYMN
ncbi:glycosyltransferase family 8 protein, partial [Candidatus Saccharibacteria bacterium]|nr:glycosyltransferase family 8 protein [Candidatus Saccharibacteria bacterium]